MSGRVYWIYWAIAGVMLAALVAGAPLELVLPVWVVLSLATGLWGRYNQ